MKTRSETFLDSDKLQWEYPEPGVKRQILGYDGQLMLVRVDFEKGAVGATHSHYHTQSSYVANGKFEVTVNGEKQILGQGDGFLVAPDEPHGVVALEAGTLIDAFTPHRESFLKK